MLFKIIVITAVLTGCLALDICPNGTERLFFTAEYPYPYSISASQSIELNFGNSTSIATKWPIELEFWKNIRSFQLPNILVLDQISSILIYHQAMKMTFKVYLPSERAGLDRDAVFEVDNVLYYCGYKILPMTQFPGIGSQRYFELFIQDNKVFAAGVVATPIDRFRNAVMFEVDNHDNKIEIKGPFEFDRFMSMCS